MTYVLCFIWPGTALSLIRSYAEHRASADPAARTAIVADSGPLALLFLNNNLHIWHHAYPALPYAPPAAYRADPDAFPQAPRYAHYGVIFTRFLLRPHDRLVHPARFQASGDRLARHVRSAVASRRERRFVAGPCRTPRPHGDKRCSSSLTRDRPLPEIWAAPDLLLAQTCGYPLMTSLGKSVVPVATRSMTPPV
jgi:hypothetical protein